MKRQGGFTLIELMISITIIGIIMSFAVSSLSDFWDKKRLIAAAEAIYSEYQFARSEAIARSANVRVVFSAAHATDWSYGTTINSTCTPGTGTVGGTTPCVLVVDDGDGNTITGANIDDGTGTIDSDDLVLRRFGFVTGATTGTNPDFPGASLVNVTTATVVFDSTRGTANGTTIRLQSDDAREMRVIVGPIGRVRICSPAGATTKVHGYKDCS